MQSLFPCSLLPMTRDPDPAAGTTHPLAFHPYCRHPGTHYPAARHPNIVGAGPSPVTPCPDIPGSRRYGLRFNPQSRRSSGDHDLSCWGTGRSHFLCGRCSCNCRRFACAAPQRQWRQRQQINAFSHIRLLSLNSFCAGDSALCVRHDFARSMTRLWSADVSALWTAATCRRGPNRVHRPGARAGLIR